MWSTNLRVKLAGGEKEKEPLAINTIMYQVSHHSIKQIALLTRGAIMKIETFKCGVL